MLQGMATVPLFLLGVKLTTVIHCRWEDLGQADCKIASTERFMGANGITTSADGNTVFVNDPAAKLITIMKR